MSVNTLMGRTFLRVGLPDTHGGKHMLTPARGLNEVLQVDMEGGCQCQKACELAMVCGPLFCISAVSLKTDFSGLRHHLCGHGLSQAVRNSLKRSKQKAWFPSWKGFGAEDEIPVLAVTTGMLPSADRISIRVCEQTPKQREKQSPCKQPAGKCFGKGNRA